MHPSLANRQYSPTKFFLLAGLVIVLDQLSKWAVHTYMPMGTDGEIPLLGHWAKLHYTLNPGMAFGAQLPAPYGKLVLTGFRLLAVSGLVYYIIRLCRQRIPAGYIACLALILGGAVGNLIDSVFYGIIYGNAPLGSPMRWFYGQVIDMIFVPLYQGYFPESWPLIGGQYSSGFPIFNVADASISVGVFLILLNQSRFFRQSQSAAPVVDEGEQLVSPARNI
ncbi:lipoprotein signal peptidase [Hymenobacter sp. BT664]|uniref:Lipoprotein signal peptidase n=1 Tax=Hymenobacter montanus TaxID=2771359 RepID=A0A927GK45_9BACT|nr:lipoprotein signal peptidase [Hymenobacter montanus]MBD2769167.1 lipoprotein signal peptidase [Hymenobacter montanus]